MKLIINIFICVFLSSCISKPAVEVWEDLTTNEPTVSIFIGYIESAKHISVKGDEDGCKDENGDEIICTYGIRDPSPIKLTIAIEDHFFGTNLGPRTFANTTNHYGLGGFQVGEEQKYLMIVLSDGETNILPRNHFKALYELHDENHSKRNEVESDVAAAYAWLPSPKNHLGWEDYIYWLPCDLIDLPRQTLALREHKIGFLWWVYFNDLQIEKNTYGFYKKVKLKKIIDQYKEQIMDDERYFFEGATLYKNMMAVKMDILKKRLNKFTEKQIYEAYESDVDCQ